MKNCVIIFCIAAFALCSCDRMIKADYDLGDKVVYDPLYGFSPSIKSDFAPIFEWPILNYFKPDSVNHLAYLFEVEFNDESIRQNGIAKFYIVDDNYDKLEGIDLYCNGNKCQNSLFSIPAKKPKMEINLRLDIPFEMGDTEINGYIIADNSDMDEVNEIELKNNSQYVGTFYASQIIRFAWGFWLFLLILLLLIIYLLFKVVSSFFISLKIPQIPEYTKKNIKTSEKEEKHLRVIPFFQPRIGNSYDFGLLGIKTMVFGASVYCNKILCPYYSKCTVDCQPYDDKCPEYMVNNILLHDTPTAEVDNYLSGDSYTTYKTFTKFLSMFYEQRAQIKKDISPEMLWEGIAFQEYVQRILPKTGSNFRATFSSDFTDDDFKAFTMVILTYRPKLIVFWGKPLKDEIKKRFHLGDGSTFVVDYCGRKHVFCFLHHPSMGFNYDDNMQILVKAHIEAYSLL